MTEAASGRALPDIMLSLTKIRDLDLSHSVEAEDASFLSAASGLVRAGSFLYVVADDELHLGIFPATGNAPGHLIRLFEGALPASKADLSTSLLNGVSGSRTAGRRQH